MAPLVASIQALRGVQDTVAITVVAELGDLTRFDNPRQLAAFVGLTPSEYSSGATRRQGGITKPSTRAACSSRALGPIAIPPRSRPTSRGASRACPNRFVTPAGRPRSGSASVTAGSVLEASTRAARLHVGDRQRGSPAR
jgi:hypothetical protein